MRRSGRVVANDKHSKLNRTRHREVLLPSSPDELRDTLNRGGSPIAICGARHAMGGQQFIDGGVLIDTRRMNRVLSFDTTRGLLEVEAGIQWPALQRHLRRMQTDTVQWGIRQKQTGADDLTLGGALAANVHGRGLAMPPIVADVEAFTLFDAEGRLHRCSRTENRELFASVIGGYGLFGVIYSVTLRLMHRQKLERRVEVTTIDRFLQAIDERVAADHVYGDFQYAIDLRSDDFLKRGVMALYRTLPDNAEMPESQLSLQARDWMELLRLAFVNKSAAFTHYANYYLSTQGQRYYSDTHQFGPYVENYATVLRRSFGWPNRRSLMISELYVPRNRLLQFMAAARDDLRRSGAEVIYGTVRLIEPDVDTLLPWARARSACVIFNLAVDHTAAGIEAARSAFTDLIDRAIECGGSYYLTYHCWARRDQLLKCYPNIRSFVDRKLRFDPRERFQSNWYRYVKALLA